MNRLIFLGFCLLPISSRAVLPAARTPEEAERIDRHNPRVTFHNPRPDVSVLRPFAEYERARYLIMDGDSAFDSKSLKSQLVARLPRDMMAVILVEDPAQVEPLRQYYSSFIESERLRVLVVEGGIGFWARDSLPLPVYTAPVAAPSLALVGALYHHGYQPGAQVGDLFHTLFFEHEYYYEGGNFAADRYGHCATVEHPASSIPDAVFTDYYGCRDVTRLPFVRGIGHVDERAKFLSDRIVVTDEPAYARVFREAGYDARELPQAATSYGTYVNSLLVNGTIFLPIYGEPGDEIAIGTYRDLGFDVVPLDSVRLSSQGMGSIHCITMTYPEGGLERLLADLGK